jgi:hypothetical protein
MDHWSRRQVVQGVGAAGLALAAGCGRWPGQAQAQQRLQFPRLGVLFGSVSVSSPEAQTFRQGLRDLAYVEGQNVAIEYRSTEGARGANPRGKRSAARATTN